MKVVVINFTDHEGKTTKKYSTCSIKTGVMTRLFKVASRYEGLADLEAQDLGIDESMEFIDEVKQLIVLAFGNQFTFDDLENGVDWNDILKVFKNLLNAVSGGIVKN